MGVRWSVRPISRVRPESFTLHHRVDSSGHNTPEIRGGNLMDVRWRVRPICSAIDMNRCWNIDSCTASTYVDKPVA